MPEGSFSSASSEPADSGTRRVVYCLIPRELADKLHDPLRHHFVGDPGVEVIVERRAGERRVRAERRAAKRKPPKDERRRVHGTHGRRVGERRAATSAAPPPDLPRRARRYAAQLSFFRRTEPAGHAAEDRDTARVVARFQLGDKEAFSTLYRRYYDRVFAYMRTALRNHHEAEDATQLAFTRAFQGLPDYKRGARPFRAWLFTIVRNVAISELRASGRVQLVAPDELDRQREESTEPEQDLSALEWITDPDLQLFVERLPLPQRQVLMLRYVMGMNIGEIAEVLERTEVDIRGLHYRATEFLRARLEAIGREAPSARGAKMQRRMQQAPVLRYRRFALNSP